MMNSRSPLRRWLPLACLFLAAQATPARAVDASARSERLNNLIESLNTASSRRGKAVEAIYAELRGPDSREMQEMLREALTRTNTLILQGAVEAMAMLGDVRDLPFLEAMLAVTHDIEVKNLTIRLLPAFCLRGERARINYHRYVTDNDPMPDPRVLAPLRRPPLTRRGRLDPELDALRIRVTRTLARQFDPVATALAYVQDRNLQNAARGAVAHYVGNALGNDPVRWRDIWSSQSRSVEILVPDEMEEIAMSTLRSMSDMGAEGLPDVIESLGHLLRTADTILSQAAFDALSVMSTIAFDEVEALAEMEFDSNDEEVAAEWQRRRLRAAVDLAVFAAGHAGRVLTGGADPARFVTAAACLGSALSFPPDFPDPDGRLEQARAEGMATLELLLMMPDLSREKRAAVILALGDIGLPRAATAIASILSSPYVSPSFGPDALRLAESAMDALRNLAVSRHEGRTEARAVLLSLLSDKREYPPVRPDSLPVGLAHMALWRLQRLARSTDTTLDPALWRSKLGW